MFLSWKRLKAVCRKYPFFPAVMVFFTKEHRYLPEFQWAQKFWVYNFFRLYETLFWRRYGIRAEVSATIKLDKNNKLIFIQQAHSFEAACALAEFWLRDFVKLKIKIPVKIWIPQLSSANGLPNSGSPFMFAIAFDTAADGGFDAVSSPITWSHTVTGSNPWIAVGNQANVTGGSTGVSAVTYNSVGLTKLRGEASATQAGGDYYFVWHLIAPASGAHTVSCTYSPSYCSGLSISYSGVAGTPVDTTGEADEFSTSQLTLNLTAAAANEWIVAFVNTSGGSTQPLSDGTKRIQETGVGYDWFFDKGPLSSGSVSINITPQGTSNEAMIQGVLIVPASGTTTSTTITTSTTTTSSSTTTTSSSTSKTTSSSTSTTTTSSSTTSTTSTSSSTSTTTTSSSTSSTTSSSTSSSTTTTSSSSSTTHTTSTTTTSSSTSSTTSTSTSSSSSSSTTTSSSTSSSTTTTSSSTTTTTTTTISTTSTITGEYGLTRTKAKDFIISAREH